jgi:phosphate starvation-inducible PhoH-like protein
MKKKGNKNANNKKYIDDILLEDLESYNDKKMYENFNHISTNEKNILLNKLSKPRNASQKKYLYYLNDSKRKIIIASGPAGTGKTLFGVEYGIHNLLLGNYEKLIFTRPAVSVDEELGFLPGTIEDKMAPWTRPIHDILHNFIYPTEVKAMMTEKTIEIVPLGFMRGRTFKNTCIVADEMQNSTVSQMKMLLTRLGENSRLIITGDLEQHDRHNDINGLQDFLDKFKDKRSDSISSITFNNDDIERDEIVRIFTCSGVSLRRIARVFLARNSLGRSLPSLKYFSLNCEWQNLKSFEEEMKKKTPTFDLAS